MVNTASAVLYVLTLYQAIVTMLPIETEQSAVSSETILQYDGSGLR
jgi:hypothetical protein